MKLLFNRIILHLASLVFIYGQFSSPSRFSLKSAGDGEVSYFEDGFASNDKDLHCVLVEAKTVRKKIRVILG